MNEGKPGQGWLRRWWPALAWAVVLFAQSSIPGDDIPAFIPVVGWDKVIHLVLYGILAWLAMRGRAAGPPAAWIIWLLCVAYGASDEAHQLFVPGRFASVWDLAADALGALLAVLLYGVVSRKREQNRHNAA